jgi:hypothetical protein
LPSSWDIDVLTVQGKKVPSVKKDGEIIPRAGILWLTGS